MRIKENKKENDAIAINQVVKELGIKREILQYHIEQGDISCVQGRIPKKDFNNILEQRKQYIGLREYINTHDGGLFEAKYTKNRNKYIDFLEDNEYFGVERYYLDNVLFNLPDKEEFYFRVEDINILDFKSIVFFENFGVTEEENINKMIKESIGHQVTLKYLKEFLETRNENIYTPSYSAFIKILLESKDVMYLTEEDIVLFFETEETEKTKELLIVYLNMVSKKEPVKFGYIKKAPDTYNSISAYTYEEYVELARILFSKEYDFSNGLTEKALTNHKYAEMWLFLSLHYMCGWRASDICDAWIYPCLSGKSNPFSINLDTLRDDIRKGTITDENYEKVAKYCIDKIKTSNRLSGKTQKGGTLHVEVTEELRVFIGKLMLIAEFHHHKNGEGYMKKNRIATYCNWTECRDFFGQEFCEKMGKQHIQTRRLNKSYLQGLEINAREETKTALLAHIVASYARNHKNINTTLIYLEDHGLSGESAEVVLYSMLQRGVFGAHLYTALVSAFPDAFEQLTMKEQSEIMQKMNIDSYELEISAMCQVSKREIIKEFEQGNVEEPLLILKTMLEVGMGRGKAKDKGIFCIKRALCESCSYPHYESCLANVCPYHVFTAEGVPALIKVIKDYQNKAMEDRKYAAVLKKKIIPAFQYIINEIIKEMSETDRRGLKVLVEEQLRE